VRWIVVAYRTATQFDERITTFEAVQAFSVSE
jgi:hypothetical protein